ncbi:MAG: hypothetical protein SOI57_01840 [Leuconostoc gelidum]|jgi:hypothetical protein|uniref:hypothetical protein n=1 Tax=Leuconostoc gelidum TaxID=1244 RepID=UPI002F34F89C
MYNIKSKAFTLNDVLFILSILIFNAVYTFFAAVKYSSGEDYYFYYLYSMFFLILVQIVIFFSQGHTFYEIAEAMLIFSLFSIGTFSYRDITPLFGVLTLLSARLVKISLKKVITIDFIFRLILLVLVVVLWSSGYLLDSQFTRNVSDGIILRHTYGFANPNTFGLFMVAILGEGIYLFWNRGRLSVHVLFSIVILYGINKVTDSRSALIIGFLLISLLLLHRILLKINLTFLSWIPIITFSISAFFANFVNKNSLLWIKLDDVLSNRLLFNSFFWETTPKSLFGHRIVQVTNEQALNSYGLLTGKILTNFYLTIFLGFGFVGIIIVLYLFTYTIRTLLKNGLHLEVIIFSLYLVLGLIENSVLNIFINWSLLLIINEKRCEHNTINTHQFDFKNISIKKGE